MDALDRELAPSADSAGRLIAVIWGREVTLAEAEELWGYHLRVGAADQGPPAGVLDAFGEPPVHVPGAAHAVPVEVRDGVVIERQRREIAEFESEIERLRWLLARERGARAVRLSATWEHRECVTAGATVRREVHPVIRSITIRPHGARPRLP